MECIVCGIDAETGAPVWDVFDLEFASVAPAMCRSADGVLYGAWRASLCAPRPAQPFRPAADAHSWRQAAH